MTKTNKQTIKELDQIKKDKAFVKRTLNKVPVKLGDYMKVREILNKNQFCDE